MRTRLRYPRDMGSTPLRHVPWAALAIGLLGCPQPEPLPDAPCTFDGSEPAGIALTVSVHYRSFDQGDLQAYEQVRDEVDWVAAWAERNGLVLELALNGYQAEGAIAAGETDRYAALAGAGHGFGVHHHPTVWSSDLTWSDLGADPTDAELQQSVADHRAWIGQALGPLGIDYPGGHVRLTGRTGWWAGMMEDAGYTTETVEGWAYAATGGVEEAASFDVLHPFRWAACDPCPELIADPDVPYVAVPQHPQVGVVAGGEHLEFDGTVPHLETTLLLAYLEWRAAQLAGDDPRVWAHGVTVHPEQGTAQNEDLERWSAFVADGFLDPPDERIGRSVCAVSREEIRAWHEVWEAGHPGEAAFQWQGGDGYPYRLPQLQAVYRDHFVAWHDDELDRGVRIAEIERREPGPDGFEPAGTALVVWADVAEGETVEVDLRDWFDPAAVVHGADGSEQDVSTRDLQVGREPLVLDAGS